MRPPALPRARTRPRPLLLFAAGLLAASAAGPLASVPAVAGTLSVNLVSSYEWREVSDGFTVIHLAGEVINNDAADAGLVRVTYNLFDTPTHVHGTESFLIGDQTGADTLASGERSPYRDDFARPSWYHHAQWVAVTATLADSPPDHNLAVAPHACADVADSEHICGTVRNLNATSVDQVRVIVSFKAGTTPNSTTVDAERMSLQNNGTSTLSGAGVAGDRADFEIVRGFGAPAYSSIAYLAESLTTAPGTPTDVMASGGRGSATVHWTPPASGGRPITGYSVTSTPGHVVTAASASATSTVVQGLTNGTSYTFTVSASNAVGTGHASLPSNPVVPATVPGSPTGVTANPGRQSATISWSAPASNGGSAIASYTVTSHPEGKTATTANGGTTSAIVSGLLGNQTYTFTVTATNAVGTSDPSVQSPAIFVLGPPGPPPPGPPSGVTAVAGSGYATVSWSAPAPNGSNPVTGYTVTSSTGTVVEAGPTATSAIVAGLGNGAYSFTVQAASVDGSGPSSAASSLVVVTNAGGQFHPLTPARILDTRTTNSPIAEGLTRDVPILGEGGVPNQDVAAVVLNVTVTEPTASSFLTIYPTGAQGVPTASNLNFLAGQSIPNLVVATLGTGGRVSIFNHSGTVQVIFDVQGWISTPQAAAGTDGLFRPLAPVRLMDTRSGQGGSSRLGGGQTANLQVAGTGGVPVNGASAVVLNVTAVNPSDSGYLAVLPGGPALTEPPPTSSVNFAAQQVIPNRVVVPLPANGQIRIFNFRGTVDVVVDVNGWFTDGSDTGAILGQFISAAPTRIIDTRDPSNDAGHAGPLGGNQTLSLPVSGGGKCPAGSSGAVLNVTVTDTSASSFLRVYPSDAAAQTSDLNWTAGTTIPNLVMVRLSQADGSVTIYNLTGAADVVADLNGCFN